MKKFLILVFALFLLYVPVEAQSSTAKDPSAQTKRVIFRPTKAQITEVQEKFRGDGTYTGEVTGKLNNETRAAIRKFQSENGLSRTGTLNRATLEKLNIELTDSQQKIPASPNSYASAETQKESEEKAPARSSTATKRSPIFRATADQVRSAQRLLKSQGLYNGGETGRLNADTRNGLKKFQEANSIKVTGTLNRITLEAMNIELTDKQKEDAAN
ncbi:MAG: peptidoglycan-binding protein [Acidobacteria bacterium]|nr:peptidoglycan-binding protein [Acidobacteriota bacterium]